MDNLYVSIFKITDQKISLPLESLITLFINNYCDLNTFNLNFVVTDLREPLFEVESNYFKNYKVLIESNLPTFAKYCTLPVAIVKNNTIVSGLCSVARQIIKNAPENHESKKLLGFREACLMACNESSIWTKFCEIDMINSLKDFLLNTKNYFKSDIILIPRDLTRFECHMAQPVRIHNMYKVAQDQAKLNNKKISEINTTVAKENLELNHLFGEGPYMTLADIILFPCFYVYQKIFPIKIFKEHLPLTDKWYTNMKNQINIFNIDTEIILDTLTIGEQKIVQDKIEKLSLYVSDPKRYKPRNRIYTKQPDIINALNIVDNLKIETNLSEPFGNDIVFDWSTVPPQANPKGGALPVSRMTRKCEQLENLAKPVIKIAKNGDTIVDFCSGSGHLGILLAVKLNNCKIVLLENKETSLQRAKDRVEELKLKNIIFLQCNLDYFQAKFNIGVSLHACGVATDLVLQHCLRNRASFVSCPCCYGGVHDCHHITYPRSEIFKNSLLSTRDYLVLGHSADQTHDAENLKTKQGVRCMNIIDTDRRLQAEEMGYDVYLYKMIPESCTPKNNILVGIPK